MSDAAHNQGDKKNGTESIEVKDLKKSSEVYGTTTDLRSITDVTLINGKKRETDSSYRPSTGDLMNIDWSKVEEDKKEEKKSKSKSKESKHFGQSDDSQHAHLKKKDVFGEKEVPLDNRPAA